MAQHMASHMAQHMASHMAQHMASHMASHMAYSSCESRNACGRGLSWAARCSRVLSATSGSFLRASVEAFGARLAPTSTLALDRQLLSPRLRLVR